MKQTLLIFLSLIMSMIGFSKGPPGYIHGKSSGNVDCYYRLSECNGKTVVLLRFDNRNKVPVTATWKEVFTTKQIPEKMPGYKSKQQTLAPGLSEAADCTAADKSDYVIGEAGVQRTYRADITGFEFGDVLITPSDQKLNPKNQNHE